MSPLAAGTLMMGLWLHPAAVPAAAPAAPSAAATPAPAPAARPEPLQPATASGPVLVPGEPLRLTPRIHRGSAYLGFGTGFGFSDYAQRSFAGSGTALFGIRAGAIVGDQLLLGPEVLLAGQFNKWAQSVQVGTALSSVMMEAMVFPWANVPLDFSGGVGWGSGLRVDRLNQSKGHTPVEAQGDEGVSYMVAVGWDFGAGRGSNVGLQLRYDGAHFFSSDVARIQGISLGLWLNTY